MMFQAIALALVPVFFVMALGYGAGRFGIIDSRHSGSLNTLVMAFAVPASIFVATASAPREQMLAQAPLFAIFGGVMLLLFAAWYGFLHLGRKHRPADAPMQALTVAFPNLAGVGLPIGAAVLGSAGTVPVALALAAGSLLVSPLALVLTLMQRGGPQRSVRAQILPALRASLTTPVVLAPALGILLSLSGVKPGPVVESSLNLIGQAAAGVALFLTGVVLSAQKFRIDRTVVAGTLLGNIARPLITAAIVFSLPVGLDLARAAILIAAIPSGFFGILFAINYQVDARASGSIVIASTLCSAVTLTIVIALLGTSGG